MCTIGNRNWLALKYTDCKSVELFGLEQIAKNSFRMLVNNDKLGQRWPV